MIRLRFRHRIIQRKGKLAELGYGSPQTLHLMIESMRRGFLDRARYLGDPDFSEIPLARLTSKEYAKKLANDIHMDKASSSLELGMDIINQSECRESEETTHFSVIDKDGMAISNTFTLEGGYGSKVVVSGAGFLLNNEMRDFNKKPGDTNVHGDIGTTANIIAPKKRMLISMAPTFVTRDKRLVLVTGSPGGRTIINTVLSIVLNITEFGMNPRQAVDTPRLHHQWLPDSVYFESDGFPPDTIERLHSMGHAVQYQSRQGDGHTIFVSHDGTACGINDRRSPDSKAAR